MTSDSDLEQARQTKRSQQKKASGRVIDEEVNPCLKEHRLSFQCMKDNNFEENKCDIYFDNYKNCKRFWSWIERERKRKGIRPLLPPLAEREKIKEEYKEEFIKLNFF